MQLKNLRWKRVTGENKRQLEKFSSDFNFVSNKQFEFVGTLGQSFQMIEAIELEECLKAFNRDMKSEK